MSSSRISIFGASGHGRVLADCAIAAGLTVDAFYDDDESTHGTKLLAVAAIPVSGGREHMVSSGNYDRVMIGIGDNHTRVEITNWFIQRSIEFATLIHPSAVVGLDVNIGDGTAIVAGAVVNIGVSIGRHVIVNTSASVDHDCNLGDYVHISPGAHLAGGVTVGEGAHIGTGVSVTPGITIGAWSTVGAGATVYKDVPDRVTIVGIPPRILKHRAD